MEDKLQTKYGWWFVFWKVARCRCSIQYSTNLNRNEYSLKVWTFCMALLGVPWRLMGRMRPAYATSKAIEAEFSRFAWRAKRAVAGVCVCERSFWKKDSLKKRKEYTASHATNQSGWPCFFLARFKNLENLKVCKIYELGKPETLGIWKL